MSLPKQAIEPVPEDTAQVGRKAFPKGNPYIQMRDLLGTIYTDDVFVDWYPPDGQPAIRPWRLLLVTVMQFAENLTNRQAADGVRDRITWISHKVHLTETCDEDSPNLITNVETRPATEPNHDVTEVIYDHLVANGYAPGEHFVDQGYILIDHVVRQAEAGVDLMGAVPGDNSWQARQGGHDSRQFMVDWENECAVCLQRHISCSWSLAPTRSQRPVVKIKFRHRDCVACPELNLCTNNHEKRRTLTILAPQSLYEAQLTARQRQQTADFEEAWQVRAGVEGTISQAAHVLGTQQSRYRGMDKTHLQHLGIPATINLLRIVNWLHDVPCSKTPQSRFARWLPDLGSPTTSKCGWTILLEYGRKYVTALTILSKLGKLKERVKVGTTRTAYQLLCR